MSSQLYSGTRVNHEHCEKKQPLLSKIVWTGLEGFIAAHCCMLYASNKDLFSSSFTSINTKEKIALIQKALKD